MLLRPATPLSILFFAAFALLLLSTLSTPIIKAIPLASFDDVSYGVFGYCKGDSCSDIGIGYTTESGLFSSPTNSDFDLPSDTRHTLSAILIVHPVAAFLTLVCFALAVSAHFHAPSHSPRYLMALLILTFPTLLVSLLAFLVDILLFVPHMQWGGWLVLAATVVICLCGIVTCAMRRTLVSRKARKKRIAENAEMNGQNYYESRGMDNIPPPPPPVHEDVLPRADSPPPMHSSGDNKGPDFVAFELQKTSMDDRTPLNPKNPSVKSASTNGDSTGSRPGRYYSEQAPPMPSGAAGRGRGPARDQYGNSPNNGYGPPGMQDGNMGPNRAGGPGYGSRGRGGYPPRGRGGYGPRGRGGPPGMREPPPPGWNGNGRNMAPGPGPMGMGMAGPMGRGGRGPPPGYNNYYGGQPPQGRDRMPQLGPYDAMGDYDQQGPTFGPGGANGQSIEMDGRGPSPNHGANNYGLRENDRDLQGMVGLQPGRTEGLAPPRINTASPMSPTSVYSAEPTAYVAPRQDWRGQQQATSSSPVNRGNADNTAADQHARGLSPIAASPIDGAPIELPAGSIVNGPSAQQTQNNGHGRKVSNPANNYYEDVDPRFAEPIESLPAAEPAPAPTPAALPAALIPGALAQPTRSPNNSPGQAANPQTTLPPIQTMQASAPIPQEANHPYDLEDYDEGIRSPVGSEISHFTSISQRGVNPNWRPGPGEMPPYGYAPPRAPRRDDMILNANPDFSLPGVAPPRRGRGGMRGGMRGGRGAPPAATAMGMGMASGGRFPGPDTL